MTIKIYHCKGARGIRPIWTAEEMNLKYTVEMLPFPPRVFKKEFLKMNVLGTVPYMTDGELSMTESVGISQYLVQKYGPTKLEVHKDEQDFGNYLNWLSHADATLTFPLTIFLRYTIQEPGVADNVALAYRKWFVARLRLLEKTLANREYLCSDRFTLADICIGYALHAANQLNIEEAFTPNIKRWSDLIFRRKAFIKIKSLDYINEKSNH